MEHTDIQPGEIHTPYQWVVADDAARALIVPEASDLNKLCLQTNDNIEYRLSVVSPVTWVSDGKVNTTGAQTIVGDKTFRTETTSAPVALQAFNDAAAAGGIHFRRGRGTAAAPTQTLADNVIGAMYFAGTTETGVATGNVGAIRFLAEENHTTTGQGVYLSISTTPVGAYGRLQRLKISAAGSMTHTMEGAAATGMSTQNTDNGTISESRLTVLSNSGTSSLALSVPAAGNTAANLFGLPRASGTFMFSNSGATRDFAIGTADNKDVILGTNSTERVRIMKSGAVGIGTPSPAGALNVLNAGNPTTLVLGDTAGTKTFAQIGTSADTGGYLAIQAVKTSGSTYGDIVMNLAGGYVGVGTADPASGISNANIGILTVTGRATALTASRGVTILESNKTAAAAGDPTGEVYFSSRNNGTTPTWTTRSVASVRAVLSGSGGVNGFGADLTLFTKENDVAAMTERVRVTNPGHVGVGTTEPTNGLSDANVSIFTVAGKATASSQSFGAMILENNRPTPAASDVSGSIFFSSRNNGTTPVWQTRRTAIITTTLAGSGGTNGFGADLMVYTKPDNVGTCVERVRVTNNGDVGVGTPDPACGLVDASTCMLTVTGKATDSIGSAGRVVVENNRPTAAVGDICGGLYAVSRNNGATPSWNTRRISAIYTTLTGSGGTNGFGGDLVFLTKPDNVATATERLRVTSDGRMYGTALHNNAGAVTGTSAQYIASGTYSASVTATSACTVNSTYTSQWMRVGNVVTVSGAVNVTTSGTGNAYFYMTLPIPSSFASFSQAGGNCSSSEVSSVWQIGAESSGTRVVFNTAGIPNTSAHSYFYSFTYLIV
jgi:hypothetical protein